MHPSCPNLIAQYDQLTVLKEQFDTAFDHAAQTGQFEHVQQIKQDIESASAALEKLMLVFVETYEGKEITLDIMEALEVSKSFYTEHSLSKFLEYIPDNISFSLENIEKIREAMRMGFDRALILPNTLQQVDAIETLTTLADHKLASLNDDDPNQYSEDAYFEDRGQTNDVTKSVVRNRPIEKTYLLLYQSKSIPQETKNKNPDQLDELFKQKNWNGLTLPEYLVLQRKEAEERGDHSFDIWADDPTESNFTWLLDSTIGSDKVVYAYWYPDDRQVNVVWNDRSGSDGELGARPVVVVEIL